MACDKTCSNRGGWGNFQAEHGEVGGRFFDSQSRWQWAGRWA